MEYAVRTNCLTKTYKNHTVVNQISLNIKRGEIYGFIGRNGAGKTTCMKMLCGLSNTTSGEISLFGRSGKEANTMHSRIGNLIESPGLYPTMSAYENLKCKSIALGIHKKGYIEEIIELIGLKDAGKKKVKNYSLGMKQRLDIGLALLGEPDLLILDEPVNGLDPQGIVEVRKTLKELNKLKNITVMISSHILEELYQLADTFGIIHEGNLLQELSKEQLEEKCGDHIEIKLNDVERACTIIEEMGIKDYKVIDANTINIYESLDRSGDINMKLSEKKCIVQSIQIVREKLEDYFLELTGGVQ